MSERNDSDGGAMMLLVFVGLFGIIFTIILGFIAFILTILAIFAWRKPLHLKWFVIRPDVARAFVYRGLCGAVAVPAFTGLCDVTGLLTVAWSLLPHFILGGYLLGSLGLEMLLGGEEALEPVAPPVGLPQAPPSPQPAVPPPPRQEPRPFQFASWDDEEERP